MVFHLLAGNRLTQLPESIGLLSKLELLTAHGNLLHSLPASLGKLSNLTTLNLSGNRLSSLPDLWAGLCKLEDLALSGNMLQSVGFIIDTCIAGLSGTPPACRGACQKRSPYPNPRTAHPLVPLAPSFSKGSPPAHMICSQLPASLGCHPVLHKLAVNGNALTSLPDLSGLQALRGLLCLCLSFRQPPPPAVADVQASLSRAAIRGNRYLKLISKS